MYLIKLFISKNKLNIDIDELRPFFESHPSSPDIFAFQETLNHYGYETILAKIPNNYFDELPKIFVSVIIEEGIKKTVVVEKVKSNRIKLYFGDNSHKKITINDFLKNWAGIILSLKVLKPTKKYNLKFSKVLIYTSIIGLIFYGIDNWLVNIYGFFIFMLTSIGLFLTVNLLFLKYLTDGFNNQGLCSLITNGNCNSTINFDKCLFFNFTLLDLALVYFSSTLIISLFFDPAYLKVTFWLSCISLAVILYSIYLQAFYLRTWCINCLSISALLITKFFYLLSIMPNLPNTDTIVIFKTLILFVLISTIWNLIRSILIKNSRLVEEEIRLHSIIREINLGKINLNISKVQLDSKRISQLELISIGNQKAKIQLFCILSIDCIGCKDVFNGILKITNKRPNDFGFKILLTVKNNPPSPNEIKVFERIMELNSINDNVKLVKSLNDIFKHSLPFHIWLKKWKRSTKNYNEMLEKHKEFLNQNNFKITPLIFLNAYKLSYPFNIEDLAYLPIQKPSKWSSGHIGAKTENTPKTY